MEQDKKEICSIRIMFPVESDEQAIDYKKKIAAALADNPDAHMEFRLTDIPISVKPKNDMRN
ncbi:unnamed protein product [marine sediment metagenome]|uniref:Uncharacterized protein n=1 Tax=marine sediment metagenome TaxID=412755 RepID=X1FKJ5_9ZZZZ